MRKALLGIILVLACSGMASAQGAFYRSDRLPGTGLLYVCPVPDGGTPCSSPSAIFSNSTLATPVANPIPVVQGQQLSFWIAPGQYTIQIPAVGYNTVVTIGNNIAYGTVATLPAVSAVPVGTLRQVTDALSSGNCVVGGGSQLSLCRNNGSIWVAIGDGGGTNVNGIIQSGLMAEYRILSNETAATLIDYAGNGNTATGTVGTAPTIIAGSGGLSCPGSGAVILPAALNTAKTVIVAVNFTANGAGAYQTPVAGNGASGASGGNALFFTVSQFSAAGAATQFNYFRIVSYGGNNIVAAQSKSLAGGTGVYGWTMDTATDHIYSNGIEAGMYDQNNQSSSGLQTTGAYQLCGSTTGNNKSSNYLTGSVYYAAFYNRLLTANEMAQNSQSITNALALRGIPVLLGPVGNLGNDTAIWDGDSITAGVTGVTDAFTNHLQLNNLPTAPYILNQAKAGENMVQMLASAPTGIVPGIRPNGARNAVFIWGGTNDITGTQASASAVFNNNKQYCSIIKIAGGKCAYVSMISRTGLDTAKNLINPLFRQFWSVTADGFVDIGGTSQLGCDGCNTGVYMQVDHVHPTQEATFNVVGFLQQRAYNRLFGNHDFSTATTYVAAAPAATATTSGSQSSNTVTINFASGNTCLPGTFCTCTGITPAGYNQSYWTLTGSGTQFTGYAQATGLGAITVQGTCSAPQQADADQFSILNFGAGNHTLQTCQAYTGQTVSIKNINAVASTVVSFPGSTNYPAELIDGAANVSVASKATLVLQSVLVSQAAGGCNWRQLQNN